MAYASLLYQLCSQLIFMAVPLAKTSEVPAAGGETIVDILARASERARNAALEYIGLVTPQEVEHLMQATQVRLIDVRTRREREREGELEGSMTIEWGNRRLNAVDERFVDELTGRFGREEIVIFVSRRGRRSHRAARAAAAAGYAHALSVIDGLEAMCAAIETPGEHVEELLDEALRETFPASDPVSPSRSRAKPAEKLSGAARSTRNSGVKWRRRI
ncbi:MAG: hypothetical protein IH606_16970 [Burkholderiales bacterium]|nr:hypothetical protein [Burkholderiales bacterium]